MVDTDYNAVVEQCQLTRFSDVPKVLQKLGFKIKSVEASVDNSTLTYYLRKSDSDLFATIIWSLDTSSVVPKVNLHKVYICDYTVKNSMRIQENSTTQYTP